jgi:2'-5' RNA ligase
VRLFVAVLLPEAVVQAVDDFLSPRREVEGLRWTTVEQWHITLAFMPDVADRVLDDLHERLERAAQRRTPFRLALAGGGAFPGPSRAKVLYAAVTGSPAAQEELRRLAVGARAAANKAGAAAEGARFRPHVTLARSGRPFEATRWLRVLDAFSAPAFDVGDVALVESHLGEGPRNRPRYEVLARYPLGSGSGETKP